MYGLILLAGEIGHDDSRAALVPGATSTLNTWYALNGRRHIRYNTREVLSSRTTREINNRTVRREEVPKVNDPCIAHVSPSRYSR